jgi:Fic family protein
MTWNWQHRNWPNFEWDRTEFKKLDQQFYLLVGEAIGSIKYLPQEDLIQLRVELLLNEVMNTSEIEGELLDRDSVQSSLRKAFGLQANRSLVSPAEAGVVEMMLDVYANFQQTLSHQSLWDLHAMLMNGRRDLLSIGAYRTHDDSMQIISGPIGRRRVHFEAPPSARVNEEMDQFINWYNSALTDSELTPLERASLSHLYFESIHPFEDGNGRIGRALVEKSLSQSIGDPILLALSKRIFEAKKEYYQALHHNSTGLEISNWMSFFSKTILESLRFAQRHIEFIIKKAQFLDKYKHDLNERQLKCVMRMFEAGPEGFVGGLSAKNYRTITKTTAATATRDLTQLAIIKAFHKSGELKGTRYFLNLDQVNI